MPLVTPSLLFLFLLFLRRNRTTSIACGAGTIPPTPSLLSHPLARLPLPPTPSLSTRTFRSPVSIGANRLDCPRTLHAHLTTRLLRSAGNAAEMALMWVSSVNASTTSKVSWGTTPGTYTASAAASVSTYTNRLVCAPFFFFFFSSHEALVQRTDALLVNLLRSAHSLTPLFAATCVWRLPTMRPIRSTTSILGSRFVRFANAKFFSSRQFRPHPASPSPCFLPCLVPCCDDGSCPNDDVLLHLWRGGDGHLPRVLVYHRTGCGRLP